MNFMKGFMETFDLQILGSLIGAIVLVTVVILAGVFIVFIPFFIIEWINHIKK